MTREEQAKDAVRRFEFAVRMVAGIDEPDDALDAPGRFANLTTWEAETEKRRAELLRLILEGAA